MPPSHAVDILLPIKGRFSLKRSIFLHIIGSSGVFFLKIPKCPAARRLPVLTAFGGFWQLSAAPQTFWVKSVWRREIRATDAQVSRAVCRNRNFACAHMALPRPPQTAFSPGPRAFRAPSGYGFLRRTVMASVHFGVITVDVAAPISPDGALLFRSSESLLTAILPTSS